MKDCSPGRRTLMLAGLFGAAGVLLGAFGAHFLPEWLESRGFDSERAARRTAQMETAVRYHLVHAVALVGLAAAAGRQLRGRWYRAIAALMVAGILLFSGSLYLLVAFDQPWFGRVTPFGGLAWIVAWCLVAAASCRRPAASDRRPDR